MKTFMQVYQGHAEPDARRELLAFTLATQYQQDLGTVDDSIQAVKTRNIQAAIIWLLLGIWLTYSAAMLWHIKVNNAVTVSMCRYVPPK